MKFSRVRGMQVAGATVVFVGMFLAAGVAYATIPTFTQTSVSVGASQSTTFSSSNGTSLYLGSNSAPTVVSVTTSGTQVTIKGLAPGSAGITLCNVGTASDCSSVTVTVNVGTVTSTTTTSTSSSTTGLSFAQNNLSLAIGSSQTVGITGGNGSYNISNNSSPAALGVGMSGNSIIVEGSAPGSGTVTVCDTSNTNTCGTLSVTVGGGSSSVAATGNQAVVFSPASPKVAVGQSLNVVLSGNSSGYFLLANQSPNIAAVTVANNTNNLSLTGEAAGTDSVTICAAGGAGCDSVSVTVTGSAGTTSTGTTGTTTTTAPTTTTTAVPVTTTSVTTLPTTVVANSALLAEIQTLQNAVTAALAQIESVQTQLSQLEGQVSAGSGSGITTTGGVSASAGVGAPATGNFTETLSLGMQNAQVTMLQNRLTALGFYSGPVTGYYGTLTEQAVIKYQTTHGISATGELGAQTEAALNAGE